MSNSSNRASIRRANKPLLEKRRRARINACLNQLKTLVLETLRKDTARYSKLEKADILEMTVVHLKSLRCQQQSLPTMATSTDLVQVANLYGLGFVECANEIRRYLHSLDGNDADKEVHSRLVGHLTGCVQRVELATQEQQNNLSSIQLMAPLTADEVECFHGARGLDVVTQNPVGSFQEGTIMIRDQPITSSPASLCFDIDGNNNNESNSNNNILVDLPQHQSTTILGHTSSGHRLRSPDQIHNEFNSFHTSSSLMDLHQSLKNSTRENNRLVEHQLNFISSSLIPSSSKTFDNISTSRDLSDTETGIYNMSENNAPGTPFARVSRPIQLFSSSEVQLKPSSCDIVESPSSCVEQIDLSVLQMDTASVEQCQNNTADVWRPW